MKKGLVLEGGAMRGLFTCGVLDVLMENGIEFDGAAGISAGAVFGCNYKSRQIGRSVRYNKRFCKDPRYAGVRSLIFTGDIFGVDFCYHKIPYELDLFDTETYRNNPMDFYVGVTDVETGDIKYVNCHNGDEKDLEWLRASASMPLVSRIVDIDGGKYLDGGVVESIPLRFMEESGYDRNIVVLTQPEGFVKKPNEMMFLMRIALRKYPNMIKAIATRHLRYNEETKYVSKRESDGDILVIRPSAKLPIGRIEHDPDVIEEAYQLGRKAALEKLVEIKSFLEK